MRPEATPQVEPHPAPAASAALRGSHPALPALFSALLLFFAFPPADRGYVAWFALVPLFLLIRSERPARQVYAGAWVGSFAFWALALSWVRKADPSAWVGWLVMATILSVYWPLAIALARLAVRRLRLPLMLAAPLSWLAFEYVRSLGFLGFPWYNLAHSQYQVLPLIQVADLAGAWGVSLLVALVNAWIVELLTLPLLRATPEGPRPAPAQVGRVLVLAAAVLATLAYGSYRLATSRFRPGPRLALLQSDFEQRRKMAADPNEILREYGRLAVGSLSDPGGPPDLIVWPETAYPYGYVTIEPGLPPATFAAQVRRHDPESTPANWRRFEADIRDDLHKWADRARVPMLLGSSQTAFGAEGLRRYNAALLVRPGVADIPHARKRHLVPFGEYIPLVESLPWLVKLTPYEGSSVPHLDPGPAPGWLELPPWRLGVVICFEDTLPGLVRRLFAQAPGGRGPDLLVNLSNDGWFRGTAEHDVHLAISVFRAVENRAPMARAVNTGVSAVIDGDGRLVRRLPAATAGRIVADIPLDDREAPYSSWGDWLPTTCLAIGIGLLPLAWLRRRSVAHHRDATSRA